MMKKYYIISIAFYWLLRLQAEEKELEPVTALHSKIYCVIPPKAFSISEIEKPRYYRPFERDIAQNFSWTFRPAKSSSNIQKCFVLIGYADQDSEDAQVAAANILQNPLFLGTASTDSKPTGEIKTQDKKSDQPAAAQSTGQVTPSVQPKAPEKSPVQSKPVILTATDAWSITKPVVLTSQDAAKAKQAPGKPIILTAQDTIKKEPVVIKKAKPQVTLPEIKERPLLLDVIIACSNDKKRKLNDQDAEDIMPGSKMYGESFDLIKYKNCQVIAKKYKDDAPPDEIKEAMEQLYFAIKEPSRIFE